MTDLMFSLKYLIFDLVYFRRCIAMINFNSIHVILFSVPPDPVRIYDADGQERMTFVGPYVPGQDLLLTCTAFKGQLFTRLLSRPKPSFLQPNHPKKVCHRLYFPTDTGHFHFSNHQKMLPFYSSRQNRKERPQTTEIWLTKLGCE